HAVDVHHYYQPAEVVTAEVKTWLASSNARREPFFIFAHYMDPHDPYFVHPFNGEGYARVANPNPPPSVAALYRRLYDGEIAYLDAQLGVLFDDLRARGLYDRTLIVLTAAHGEEFQEHGGWWHGTSGGSAPPTPGPRAASRPRRCSSPGTTRASMRTSRRRSRRRRRPCAPSSAARCSKHAPTPGPPSSAGSTPLRRNACARSAT